MKLKALVIAGALLVAGAIIDKYLLDLYPNGYMGDPNPQVVKFGMGGSVVLQ